MMQEVSDAIMENRHLTGRYPRGGAPGGAGVDPRPGFPPAPATGTVDAAGRGADYHRNR
ncbi:MAG: hypothetical protein QOD82_934 [Pseudonocardiales bacterium]|jgi:hypothetical protein|nr:hypothetical protein [Pseudonocardiales bacterium]MDT7673032.1 hypothetical protein [Pseudonocardiales bacterium]